eukprot:3869125-Rhodomonas_salina.8
MLAQEEERRKVPSTRSHYAFACLSVAETEQDVALQRAALRWGLRSLCNMRYSCLACGYQAEQLKLQHQKTQMQQMLDFAKQGSPMSRYKLLVFSRGCYETSRAYKEDCASSPINRSPLRGPGERGGRSPNRRRHRVVESHKQAFIQAVQLEQEGRWPEAIHAFTKVEHVPAYRMMCLLKRAMCFSKVSGADPT